MSKTLYSAVLFWFMMSGNEIMEKLIREDIPMVEYHGGVKQGQVEQIEQADFRNYRWAGIIVGDRAIFMANEYERANKENIEKMLDMWSELKKKEK